jgi:hypothetical protein
MSLRQIENQNEKAKIFTALELEMIAVSQKETSHRKSTLAHCAVVVAQ